MLGFFLAKLMSGKDPYKSARIPIQKNRRQEQNMADDFIVTKYGILVTKDI